MPSISIVLPAPFGLAACMPYQQLAQEGGFDDVEIIVCDGSHEGAPGLGLPGMRHLHLPGASVYELRRAGIIHAGGEWILLTEDHCRFMPRFLAAYRDAIRERPDADLFSGAVTNESAPTHSTMANFFWTFHDAWPASKMRPALAPIANLAIRRSAIPDDDLSRDGGFEFMTLARLARTGRLAHCPEAMVDHVQNGGLLYVCRDHFGNGRSSAALSTGLRQESGWNRARGVFHHCAAVALVRPLAVTRSVRRVYPMPWPIAFGLLIIGASHALGAVVGAFAGDSHQVRKQ